jgi:4-amino-4-deoxy-L-arabinose transferase-like glycosyltransferase
MPRSAASAPSEAALRPLALLTALAAAVTLARLALLAVNRTDLFVDEAQYWLWSRDLAFGYYSKPPLIAWVIRAATELGDSSAFWIRAPGPVLHGATAMLVGLLGARLHGARTGLAAGAIWLTMPAVALGTQVISTDTVMLPFFAAALWLWVALPARPSAARAALAGACLGVAFLGKYAALYFVLCAALWALADRAGRPARRDVLAAAAAFAAVAAPNLVWNALQGGVTLDHTLHNAGRTRFPQWGEFLAFLGAQAGVLGPVVLAAWVWALRRGPGPGTAGGPLFWFSVPILAIVAAQALRSGAEANWAAAAMVAAAPMTAAQLLAWGRRATVAALALNAAASVALPLAAAFPEALTRPGGRPALARVMGQADFAGEIGALARAQGLAVVQSADRAVLAALAHGLRDAGVTVAASPWDGPPRHHFDLAAPAPRAPALLLTGAPLAAPPEGWSGLVPVRDWTPPQPFLRGRPLHAYRLDP